MHKLTIPEGLTSEQIVQRLRDDDVSSATSRRPPREGSLMPDTYYFERGDTRQAFWRGWRRPRPRSSTKSGRSARRPADQIAGRNGDPRLDRREGDRQGGRAAAGRRRFRQPTAEAHAARIRSDDRLRPRLRQGHARPPITKAELNQATPYNTYIIEGLPPGPISNPGKAALEAVANPLRSKDLYFVADGTGGHAFAETLEQHRRTSRIGGKSKRTRKTSWLPT